MTRPALRLLFGRPVAVLAVLAALVFAPASVLGRPAAPSRGPAPGWIDGSVWNDVTSAPLANVTVQVMGADGAPMGSALSAANGYFRIDNLTPGTYYARTLNDQGFVDELYDGVIHRTFDVSHGTPIRVSEGVAAPVTFRLSPGGRIRGRLTAAGSSAPLNDQVWVDIHDANGFHLLSTRLPNVDGYYITSGLPPGIYYARTNNSLSYINEVFNDLPFWTEVTGGQPITVTLGATTENVDFALAAGGRVTGRMTNAAGAGLGGSVCFRSATNQYLGCAGTDSSGDFTTPGLPAGNVFATTFNSQGYIDELYDGVRCLDCDATVGGTPIPVTVGGLTPGIDFVLELGGRVSGRITNAAGNAIPTAAVKMYDAGGVSVMSTHVDPEGYYTTQGLPAGSYYVHTGNSSGYVNESWDDVVCVGCGAIAGVPVTVATGQTTGNINFQLAMGGSIAGRVTDGGTGAGIGGGGLWFEICESALRNTRGVGTSPDASGHYTLSGLPAGAYYISTQNTLGFFNQLYNQVSPGQWDLATAVTVTAGSTTENIHFVLTRGGRITGRITSGTGAGLAAAGVRVYNAGGSQVTGAQWSDSTGAYTTLGGLPTGTFYVRSQNTSGYVDELYNNFPSTRATTWGTPVSVTAPDTTANIDFALEPGGRISGRVYVGSNPQQGLENVTVEVYDSAGIQVASALTGATGDYLLPSGLPSGTYYAKTSNSLGYNNRLYDAIVCQPSCTITNGTPIAVTSPQTRTGIDFGLLMGGRVSGRVTAAAGGSPLANVTVTVVDASGNARGTATTDASGNYTVRQLTAGTYYALTSNSSGHLDELYQNVPCATGCSVTAGTPIAVTLSQTTGGIDFALDVGGRIAGRITDASTHTAVTPASVSVYDSAGNRVTNAPADATGSYLTGPGLPAGTYYVRTLNSAGYQNELWNNIPCASSCPGMTTGTPVAVTLGATTPSVDFALDLGGRISGRVTDGSSTLPLGSVTVEVYNSAGNSVGSATTGAGGDYLLPFGLPAGTYYAKTNNSLGYNNRLYDAIVCQPSCTITNGMPIPVTVGQTTPGINFGLLMGGKVAGRVTAAAGGAPLSGVTVTIYNASGGSMGNATTDGSGTYTVPQLTAGTFYARTTAAGSYLNELYQNLDCAYGCSVTSGTAIPVSLGQTTGGVDFSLGPGGSITGRVTAEAGGAGIAATVTAMLNGFTTSLQADASGAYSIDGLPPGTFYVFTSQNPAGLVNEYYDNQPYMSAGTAPPQSAWTGVPVTAGQTTANVNFALAAGGRVGGTVTDSASHAPLQGVIVRLYDFANPAIRQVMSRTTDASGAYAFGGLLPGVYYLRTANTIGYVDEEHDNQPAALLPSYQGGTPVVVTAASLHTIDFALDPGGRISGRVTDEGGQPLQNITVNASNAYGLGGSGVTDASGNYLVATGLPSGTYFARTSNSRGYVNEIYDNLVGVNLSPTIGTPITVARPAVTPNVDFALARGGWISGTVRNAQTSAPASGIRVTAYYANETGYLSSTLTDAGGSYTLLNLPGGGYYVGTASPAGGYLDQVYRAVACQGCPVTSGELVPVTQGAATTGIDFSLVPAPAATNDLCTNAKVIVTTPFTDVISVVAATRSPDDPWQSCGDTSPGSNTRSVWYRFTAPADGILSADTKNSTYDTAPSIHRGSCGSFTELACFDTVFPSTPGFEAPSLVTTAVTAGTTYYLEVTSFSSTAGTLVLNVTFTAGGYVSGRVTAADGTTPLCGRTIVLADQAGRDVVQTSSDATGSYRAGPVQPGTYLAVAVFEGYVFELYRDARCVATRRDQYCRANDGVPVVVTAGATTPNVDFTLETGGRISGTVTDAATSGPLPGVEVRILNAAGGAVAADVTDASGRYQIWEGLPAGTYYAVASTTIGYEEQAYDRTTSCVGEPGCTATPTPIVVTPGTTTPGIDFALVAGGRIQGVVREATGHTPIAGAEVIVADGTGREVARAVTGSSGGYLTPPGLAAGTYYVYTDNNQGYINLVYPTTPCLQGCSLPAGTPVTVSAGAVTSGIVFSLQKGARITGNVTKQGTSVPLADVEVHFYNGAGTLVGHAFTDAAGYYLTDAGLPGGSYYARTGPYPGYAVEVYDNQACPGNACAPTSGTPIAVTAPATAGGINFTPAACGPLTASPAVLPGASLGVPYTQTLSGAGGTAPYTVGLKPGTLLPPGLVFGSGGAISGTPTANGRYAFLVGIVDSAGCIGQQVYQVAVTPFEAWSISGQAFGDANANGRKDAAEPGSADWTIFLDANANGALDPGETSTVTEASGFYAFTALAPGTYRVRQVQRAGWLQTTPDPAPILLTSTAVTGVDFGNVHPVPVLSFLVPSAAVAGTSAFAITVGGTSFVEGATVLWNGQARPTTVVSATQVTAVLLPGDLARAGIATVTVQNPAPTPGPSNTLRFTIAPEAGAGGRDFNNDGQSDILWESSEGWVAAWLMNGVRQVQNLLLYDYPVAVEGWHIVGTGDFNGDGQADILWQSDAGYVAAWMMNGTTQAFNQLLYDYPVAVSGWHVAAAGDLDGDGISDILWQNDDGYVAYWLMGVDMSGRAFQRTNALLDPRPVAAGGWRIAGTGDLNGDGMADLVWQSPDGYVAAWIMNRVTQVYNTLLYTVRVATDGWMVVGTADMNGDGMVDLLWQKWPTSATDPTFGYLATWLMNGASHASTVVLEPSRITDPAWRIVGPK